MEQKKTAVIIVCPMDPSDSGISESVIRAEAKGLCRALRLDIHEISAFPLRKISPSTYITKGYLESIKDMVTADSVGLVYIDAHIKPGQQRDLERALNAKVIDRTGLILEIFADRAQTQEGRIQVALAYKTYQKSRLVRAWTHLERQRGAMSFIGGPGEKQTELDRRALDNEIKKLEKDLQKVRSNRQLQRKARERELFPVIALVGYTNAGKSTLFNRLTNAEAFARDMLFATLDPTMRAIRLPGGQQAILSDTVGFIRNLPTELIAAFSATLEEVTEADIILHVQDISAPDHAVQKETVDDTLRGLGVDPESDHVIEIYNKVDLLRGRDAFEAGRVIRTSRRDAQSCALSAVTGEGIPDLINTIVYHLHRGLTEYAVDVPVTDGKAIAWLHSHVNVIDVIYDEEKGRFRVEMGEAAYNRFNRVFGYPLRAATGS